MKKIFIGGSRRITRLNSDIRSRIEMILDEGNVILVGDANGADKSVQRYLREKEYDRVLIYYSGHDCRNNVGNWPTNPVIVATKTKNLDFYTAKDRSMAEAATRGIMIWDGNSVGTLLNVRRLMTQKKPVEIYISHDREFWTLENDITFEQLVSKYAPHLANKLNKQVKKEGRRKQFEAQLSLI